MSRCLLIFAWVFLWLDVWASAGPLWVAVGYGGRRMASVDGVNWENDQRWSDEARDDDNVLFDVAYGRPGADKPARFVAVGGGAKVGHILSTVDGKGWKELPQRKGRVATIAFGRDRFVAAHDGELLSSADGEDFAAGEKLDWKASIHARKSAFGEGEGGGMFVIIGDADFSGERERVSWRAATPDGVSFAKADHHTAEARDVAFGAGHFVVVGPAGLIESSHDGLAWQRCESDSAEDFHDVAWTGRRFIARGDATWTSTDGLTWSKEPRRLPCTIAWSNELLTGLPLRALGFSWGGNIHVTADFTEWRKVALPVGPSFTAVAFREE